MKQAATSLDTRTDGPGLYELSDETRRWAETQGIETGLLTVFCRHTSCSLLIQENAAPAARRDLERYFSSIAPEDAAAYEHDEEGPDDMPAHLRAALTQTSLSIPLMGGRLTLGTWQGIFLFEHRRRAHERSLALHLLGV
ncbi:hypothetical protein B5C34_09485 [Pacificimonas flava]|uniref:Secondary thiamine-phosphate synthase enzyme n=2 Tax=Pacificimonas TaxID=1960290 RepID=A0A219B5M6_9SPHN|nr:MULTISPECIES: secondary thiamine-phosphate synthase enzyme YjbQ [Pacificimonas]MBZ6379097.1 secondary thiamine-phosphate synthase enzyme YjbQ [Pacificimonas aurantium]OWV33670.1 hypothetical protein B5C34_09485 [Pacificimonas flava]